MSVANQKIVKLVQRDKWDKENIYARMHIDALQEAMLTLKGQSFRLWVYLNKNQDDYSLELSPKACADWGIKKDAYYQGIKDLTSAGYLWQKEEGSNIYYFSEKPKPSENQNDSEKPNISAEDSENQKPSENQKEIKETADSEFQNVDSEKPKGDSEIQKMDSENPYRNITNNTDKTSNITEEFSRVVKLEGKWIRELDGVEVIITERYARKIEGDMLAGEDTEGQMLIYWNVKKKNYYGVFNF